MGSAGGASTRAAGSVPAVDPASRGIPSVTSLRGAQQVSNLQSHSIDERVDVALGLSAGSSDLASGVSPRLPVAQISLFRAQVSEDLLNEDVVLDLFTRPVPGVKLAQNRIACCWVKCRANDTH